MLKKYKFGFDVWALILFLAIMLPNLIWFGVPAPDDVLRNESKTQIADIVASVCQIIFVAALCLIRRADVGKIRFSPLIFSVCVYAVAYFIGWILYYCGIVGATVILLLTLPPCLAFLLYAIDRKNFIALIPITVFTVCHLIYGIVNFIV